MIRRPYSLLRKDTVMAISIPRSYQVSPAALHSYLRNGCVTIVFENILIYSQRANERNERTVDQFFDRIKGRYLL